VFLKQTKNGRCSKAKGLLFLLIYCIFRYSYNKIFWRPWNFCESKMLVDGWQLFSKTLAGKEL